MSYDILIGNKTFETDEENPDEGFWTVDRIELPEAPCFDNDHMTGRSNMRSPSYRGWDEFAEEVGLLLLLDELMGDEPFSCVALEERHLAILRDTIRDWKAAHPGTTPGFRSTQDPQLARLLWLDWWIDWALKNCPQPTFFWS